MGATRTELVVDGPVIVGAGLAGLSCAIELAPAPCLVVSAGEIGAGTSTGWAQGGMAAAVGPDDSPEEHAADTLAAGAGLCNEAVVRRIADAAPDRLFLKETADALRARFGIGHTTIQIEIEGQTACTLPTSCVA